MKKLMIAMVALSSMVSVVAMEQQALIPITKEENDRFVRHTKMATTYAKQAVNENKISSDNGLFKITIHCDAFLELAKFDLSEMIKNQDLHGRLENFKKFELDEKVIAAKKILLNESNDRSLLVDTQKELSDRRKELIARDLETKQPTYSKPVVGEFLSDARINFMIRNKDYSLEEEAVKDYIATLIYQYVLANRVVIYDEAK